MRITGAASGELAVRAEAADTNKKTETIRASFCRRFMRFLRLADFEALSIHEDVFDFGLFVKEVAVGHDEIGDLALVEGAEAVLHAEDFRGREGHRAERVVLREPGVNRLFCGFQNVFRGGDAAGKESELYARLAQSLGRRRRAVAELERAK